MKGEVNMGKEFKVIAETEKAFRFIAKYEDFDGGLQKWKDAFYEVWRHQLTYSFAYEIEIRETRAGVRLSMLVRESYKEQAKGLEELGYRFTIEEEEAGVVSDYDMPEGVETLFVE